MTHSRSHMTLYAPLGGTGYSLRENRFTRPIATATAATMKSSERAIPDAVPADMNATKNFLTSRKKAPSEDEVRV